MLQMADSDLPNTSVACGAAQGTQGAQFSPELRLPIVSLDHEGTCFWFQFSVVYTLKLSCLNAIVLLFNQKFRLWLSSTVNVIDHSEDYPTIHILIAQSTLFPVVNITLRDIMAAIECCETVTKADDILTASFITECCSCWVTCYASLNVHFLLKHQK